MLRSREHSWVTRAKSKQKCLGVKEACVCNSSGLDVDLVICSGVSDCKVCVELHSANRDVNDFHFSAHLCFHRCLKYVGLSGLCVLTDTVGSGRCLTWSNSSITRCLGSCVGWSPLSEAELNQYHGDLSLLEYQYITQFVHSSSCTYTYTYI